MVMKNAMRVNLRRSISRSLGRYIAIVLIIALGAAIFVGLLMTKSDMVLTGDVYMRRQNMFDLRLVSTYGWEQDQVKEAAQFPGIREAEGITYLDLIANTGEDGESVFRFYALSDTMNRFHLRAGRMPENPEECLADGYTYDESILGKTITLSPSNDEDDLDAMTRRTFTVVGLGGSPLYMDMNRGTTSVGSGVLKAYVYLLPEAFDMSYYPEIHLTVPEDFSAYTDAYNAVLEERLETLEPLAEGLGDARFASVKNQAEVEYRRGYVQYLEGITQYMDGRVQLYRSLERAKEQLKKGEYDILVAKRELNQAEQDLYASEAQLKSGAQQLDAQQANLDKQKADIEANIDGYRADAEAKAGVLAAVSSDLGMDPNTAAARIMELKAQLDAADPEDDGYLSIAGELQTLSDKLLAYQGAAYDYGVAKGTVDAMEKALSTDIPAGYSAISKARMDIIEGWQAVEDGWLQVGIGWEEVNEGEADIAQGWLDLEKGRQEGEEDLLEARSELADAHEDLKEGRADIDDLEPIDVFLLDRTSNAGYNSLDSVSDIVSGVARIIPVFFLLVASLVCITTMTRMIDEERTQIGTLKALGYSNGAIISKYLVYAGSGAVIGCGLGVLAGSFIFPVILWDAYKIMLYITERPEVSINWWLCGIVVGVYTAVILFVTWYCCRRALEEQPAELIRPKSPDPGKQLFVENLPLWRHMSFLNKVTIRNIFRYKQRLAMMLVGIGGCTALLLTGFGLSDSILGVVDYQYAHVTKYDMEVYFTGHQTPAQQKAFLREVGDRAQEAMFFHQSSVDLTFADVTKEIYLISGDDRVGDFIDLHTGDVPLALPGENEAILSIGVAEAMGIQVGDTIQLRNADMQVLTPVVTGIYDNHIYNYAIVAPQTLENQWGAAPEQQMAYIRCAQGQDAYTLSAEITGMDRVMNVMVSEDLASMVNRMMEALDLVVLVVVFCAGLLASIVLYNLTNININERIREIATIKVLGFNASETAAYVFKENLALTIAGGLFGLLLGELLLFFVMEQVRIDMVWFNTIIQARSYLLSFALTVAAAFIVNFIFYFKLDTINMAEALKSVE